MQKKSVLTIAATITAAVVLSTVTSATAAYVITGANIKDGTVTSADIRNGTLTGTDVRDGYLTGTDIRNGSLTLADLAAGTVRTGAAGPQGPQGPKGATGDTGPQGPAGSGVTVASASGVVPGVVWVDKSGYTRLVNGSLWSFTNDGSGSPEHAGGKNAAVMQLTNGLEYLQTVYFTSPTCERVDAVFLDSPVGPSGTFLADMVDLIQGTYMIETVETPGGPVTSTLYYRLADGRSLGGVPLYWKNGLYQQGHCTAVDSQLWMGTMYSAIEVTPPSSVGPVTFSAS